MIRFMVMDKDSRNMLCSLASGKPSWCNMNEAAQVMLFRSSSEALMAVTMMNGETHCTVVEATIYLKIG